MDLSLQLRARLGWPQGTAAQGASLLKNWSTWSRQTIGLLRVKAHTPCIGVCRLIGLGRKRNLGRTTSIRKDNRWTPLAGPACLFDNKTQSRNCHGRRRKILMTNDLKLSVRDVVELYSLRWQIELMSRDSSRHWAFTSTSSRNLSRWKAGRNWRSRRFCTWRATGCNRCRVAI